MACFLGYPGAMHSRCISWAAVPSKASYRMNSFSPLPWKKTWGTGALVTNHLDDPCGHDGTSWPCHFCCQNFKQAFYNASLRAQPAGFLQIDRILKRKNGTTRNDQIPSRDDKSPITSLLRGSSQDLLGSSPISPWCSSAIWKGEVPPSLWGTYDHQSWLLKNHQFHHQQKPPKWTLEFLGW